MQGNGSVKTLVRFCWRILFDGRMDGAAGGLLRSGRLRRSLAQTIAAQAILAIERHRQARNFFGAPAGTGQAAGEFRSAPGTGEAARGLNF
jgi:hypothetical protein